ncbi:MAG: PEP-CTERM sorting domain-containing protein [Aquabacterium sp.]|uniref:PEP-CTERM sorting domain-containing protein n=1 Tax=Aquabacterium sp. TaxID=1872578 RepID=UPI0025C57C5C|nr:PEP-CTERM sorting domain-containing protein [Aquabacterium sp.]MBI5924516.1 PEP-CTERM sorting domain-containing protein [Aquabacterium sp.]
MKFLKHFAVSFLAVAATAASAASVTLSPVTSSTVSFDTAALASNNFTATALGGSTYSSSTGILTDAIAGASVSSFPGAALVSYDAASGISLSTSIAFVGTVKVNMTNFSYNAGDNMLYGDLLVTALGSSKTYTNQSILVAGTEVGTIGADSINSVSSSAAARALNMNLSSFTLSSDLQTQLGNAVSFVSWLPAAVKSINVTSATPVTPAVPEPSTYALMGLGLVGMALVARRKQA